MSENQAQFTIGTAVITRTGVADAGRQLAKTVSETLAGKPVDLCIVTASTHFEADFDVIIDEIVDELGPKAITGTTGETVIHGNREYEGQPAIALWAAHLPGVKIRAFHLSEEDVERFGTPRELAQYIEVPPEESPYFILLADPFTFGQGSLMLLDQFEIAYPGSIAIGGMASAGSEPGQNQIVFGGQVLRSGLSGIALWGNIELSTVVSQGCRPIGRQMTVTKADQNIIQELSGRTPLDMMTEVLRDSKPRDLELARTRGILVGKAISQADNRDATINYLIRNPLGFDQDSGALAVNDFIEPGETIQFHVRDAVSADDDLRALLTSVNPEGNAGVLLFTCNGRGTRLFSDRNHDVSAVVNKCGSQPLVGISCAGEFGPVGDRNYLHGHTACIGFFRPPGKLRE